MVIMGNELKGGNFSVDSSHLIQREECGFFGSRVTLPRYTVQPHLMNTPFKESPLIPDGAKLNTYSATIIQTHPPVGSVSSLYKISPYC